MKIPGSQMLVNPVRTNETVSGAVNTPNFSQNLGIETKFAEMIEQNAYKYEELRDEEQFQYARSFILESIQAGQDFQLGLKTDDSYFKDKDKYAEYLQGNKDRKETFERLAKERGIKPEIVEAALQRSDRAFKETEAIHGKYVADYSEQKNKERNILLYDENSKLMSKAVLNGDTELGKELYDDSMNYLVKGLDKGYITADQMVARANAERENFLMSEIYSYVNDPDGELKLQELANKKFEDFYTEHEYLVGKYGDYKSDLTYEDFARWQGHISGALSKINARASKEKKKTLADRNEYILKAQADPVETISKNYDYDVNLSDVSKEIAIGASNLKYGTSYTSLEEIDNSGKPIITIDSSNTLAPIYLDTGISGEEVMQKRIKEDLEFTGELNDKDTYLIREGQYSELRGLIPGGIGMELYLNSESNFRKLHTNIYSIENRKMQKMLDGTYVDSSSFIDNVSEMYDDSNGALMELSGRYSSGPTRNLVMTETIGQTLKLLRQAGEQGDIHAKSASDDLENLFLAAAKTLIVIENGGILSDEIAEETGVKKAGLPLTELTVSERQKVMDYWLKEPGRLAKLFGGENPIKKQLKKDFIETAKEYTQNFQAVDTGYGNIVFLGPDVDKNAVQQEIIHDIFDPTVNFYKEDGKTIIPKTKIKLLSRLGSGIIIPKYMGEPIYRNGKQVMFDVGGEKK